MPGKACEQPDALSRREQDRPKDLTDEQTMGRIRQLFTPMTLNLALAVCEEDAFCGVKTIKLDHNIVSSNPFNSEKTPDLFEEGLQRLCEEEPKQTETGDVRDTQLLLATKGSR